MPGKNFKVVVRTWESSADLSRKDSRDFRKLLLIEEILQPPWDVSNSANSGMNYF